MRGKVSIIIPVFNTEKKLVDCLESVKNQSYKNFEVILIDDGSSDSSREICDNYSKKDNRFRVKHCKNSGVSIARNIGIDISKGDYIIFVDSDDKVKSNMLEDMVYNLEQYNSDVVISGLTFVDGENIIKEINPNMKGTIGLDIWEYISKDNTGLFGYVPNKLYKSDIIKNHDIRFDENKKIQEDLDFALSAYSYCNSFYLINESYYLYNYEVRDRVKEPLTYMQIEVKKRNIIKNKGLYDKCKNSHCEKLASMIFTYLYWLPKEKNKFFEGINKIYDIEGIHESFNISNISNIKSIEEKFVIYLVKKKRIESLWIYFKIRAIRNKS